MRVSPTAQARAYVLAGPPSTLWHLSLAGYTLYLHRQAKLCKIAHWQRRGRL